MRWNRSWRWMALCMGLGILALTATRGQAGAPPGGSCQKVVLEGEVNAGQEWKASFGGGWVFRVLPIQPGKAGYSGWDLVVDRERPAGYPDALLLATPPYNSINEHEVGTTFGLRAQDAIGWNPRSFHFLTDPDAFGQSQRLFQVLGGMKHGVEAPVGSSREGMAIERQLKINRKSSAGLFRIVDVRLVPGVADPAPYAQNWALAVARTPHTFEQAGQGQSSPMGELRWMRFSITLWLPAAWKLPHDLHGVRAGCSE